MAIKSFLPVQRTPIKAIEKAQVLPADDQKVLARAFRVAALAMGFNGNSLFASNRGHFEDPEYDFSRIQEAIDTDSYAHQAINKYSELFWKEGWDIVGENAEAVDYIWQRIAYMEVAMNRPFQELLEEVADQYFRFHNVFLVKSRGDLGPYFPEKLRAADDQDPVVGYYLIPTEQIQIVRNKHNKILKYKQRMDSGGFMGGSFNSNNGPEWLAKHVIHIFRKRRIGYAFGTPFMMTALDDIISLRQVEEDLLNLIHKELFPLYKYKVGTDEHPADQPEVDAAIFEVEQLRSEGGIILPHRHDVEVIGGEGKSLDASNYLAHFKERVALGLGIYPHHLGMSMEGGNRSMTDRLDTMLYDKIKDYQRTFAERIRFHIFNELLLEGGFDPFDNPRRKGMSDAVTLKFNEIDVDTKAKKEAAIMVLHAASLITTPEARIELGRDPEMDESETMAAMQARMTPDAIVTPKTPAGSTAVPKPQQIDTTPAVAKKDAQAPSTGGRPNPKNTGKGAGNIIRPANQHGRRTSPNIRRDDQDWMAEAAELLDDELDY